MKVNVGLVYTEVNGKGKKASHGFNVQSEFEGDWDNTNDHNRFRDKIYAAYPGKGIMGYCPSEKED